MNNIKDLESVQNWAKEIIDGNGTKYTVLSKSDQFQIARAIIMAYGECKIELCTSSDPKDLLMDAKDLPDNISTIEPIEGTEATSAPADAAETPTEDSVEGPSTDSVVAKLDENETRAHFYHNRGKLPQEVYDAFARYCEQHPKEKSVMDFQTGERSSMAAFAYWLLGRVGEELTIPVGDESNDDMMSD